MLQKDACAGTQGWRDRQQCPLRPRSASGSADQSKERAWSGQPAGCKQASVCPVCPPRPLPSASLPGPHRPSPPATPRETPFITRRRCVAGMWSSETAGSGAQKFLGNSRPGKRGAPGMAAALPDPLQNCPAPRAGHGGAGEAPAGGAPPGLKRRQERGWVRLLRAGGRRGAPLRPSEGPLRTARAKGLLGPGGGQERPQPFLGGVRAPPASRSPRGGGWGAPDLPPRASRRSFGNRGWLQAGGGGAEEPVPRKRSRQARRTPPPRTRNLAAGVALASPAQPAPAPTRARPPMPGASAGSRPPPHAGPWHSRAAPGTHRAGAPSAQLLGRRARRGAPASRGEPRSRACAQSGRAGGRATALCTRSEALAAAPTWEECPASRSRAASERASGPACALLPGGSLAPRRKLPRPHERLKPASRQRWAGTARLDRPRAALAPPRARSGLQPRLAGGGRASSEAEPAGGGDELPSARASEPLLGSNAHRARSLARLCSRGRGQKFAAPPRVSFGVSPVASTAGIAPRHARRRSLSLLRSQPH